MLSEGSSWNCSAGDPASGAIDTDQGKKTVRLNISLLLIALITLPAEGTCSPSYLPDSVDEIELERALTLPEGEITVDGKSYFLGNGTICRLIHGRRYRPRCRDAEMERILPRTMLAGLFVPGTSEVQREKSVVLDRLGHSLKWGKLKHYDLRITVHNREYPRTIKREGISLSHLRPEWIKDYLVRRWGIKASRIIVARQEKARVDLGPGPDCNPEYGNFTVIASIGREGARLEECEEEHHPWR